MPENLLLTNIFGLDTFVMAGWMKKSYGYDIITVVGDVSRVDVKLKFCKATVGAAARSSPMSLYDTTVARYDSATTLDHARLNGIIEIWAMPTVVANARKRDRFSKTFPDKVAAKSTAQAP